MQEVEIQSRVIWSFKLSQLGSELINKSMKKTLQI